MAKLIENTYRQVNIALVNELAMMATDLGVDIWEALHAAATKPFGYQPFWPGPGVGGHCIAIDPTYLSWRAGQQLGYRVGFIEHANEVNNRMPDYVATRVARGAQRRPASRSTARACSASGWRSRPGVDDLRGSPALEVLERLDAQGRRRAPTTTRTWTTVTIGGRELRSVPLDAGTLADTDAVIVLTAHPGVDVHAIVAARRWCSTRAARPSGSTSRTSSGSELSRSRSVTAWEPASSRS